MTSKLTALSILAGLGLATAASLSGTASAAPPVAGIVGWAYSTVAGCPYIEWRLAKHPDGQVTGIAYYSDMSGTSQVTGTFSQGGQIQLTLTSVMGNGPVGTATGVKESDGAANITLTGTGCANMHMRTKPVADILTYHQSNQ